MLLLYHGAVGASFADQEVLGPRKGTQAQFVEAALTAGAPYSLASGLGLLLRLGLVIALKTMANLYGLAQFLHQTLVFAFQYLVLFPQFR